MEIELNPTHWRQQIAERAGGIVLVLLAAVILVGFLGKTFTPASHTLLSWSEWRIVRIGIMYRKQLSTYQQYAELLADLIHEPPDPVRAQVVCDQILQQTTTGLDALEYPRLGIQEAARAVRQWAVGAGSWDTAQSALSSAIQRIQAAELAVRQPVQERMNEWR